MEIRTQQVIIEAVSKAWQGLAKAFGRETLSHSEGIAGLQMLIEKKYLSFEMILISDPIREMPDDVRKMIYDGSAERFWDQLALVNTEQKLQAQLSTAQEPSPEQLEGILALIKNAVIRVRSVIDVNLKLFPTDPGGQKKTFSLKVQSDIRTLIKGMREPGTTLADIYRSLAERYQVSETTIKRIWLRGQIEGARRSGKRRKIEEKSGLPPVSADDKP